MRIAVRTGLRARIVLRVAIFVVCAAMTCSDSAVLLCFAASQVRMADTLRLADHFPRQPKPCRKVAQAFFGCFSVKGDQPPGGDREAGRRALAECKKEMQAYDACMVKLNKGKKEDPTLFRVQEEYRKDVLEKKAAP